MSNISSKKADLARSWQICAAMVLSAVVIMAPDLAAAVDTPFGNIFCTVVSWFTGNTGKGLATIAITIIGVGALLGKVSWGMALIVGVGVAIVFGAAGIVDAMNAGASSGCSTTASFSR
jgi:type IV secretion system protein VirB2